MSNKQVSCISWNIALNLRSEWTSLDDVESHMREKFSRYEIKYCCYSRELGKQGTHPHLQGYTMFEKRYSLKKIQKDWTPCYIEWSKGDTGANLAYILKEAGTFTEFGSRPSIVEKKGGRAEGGMAAAIALAREGRWAELESSWPSILLRYRGGLERVHLEALCPSNQTRKGLWLVGSPGTGKSLFASKFDVPGMVYHKPPSKWFDGYTNQKVVVVDDLDRSNANTLGYYLKIWADHYPLLSEVKGSSIYLHHEIVIVTSNYRIDTLYEDDDMRLALHRRFKEIVVHGYRETPIGEIEIKTQCGLQTKWYNNNNIWDN